MAGSDEGGAKKLVSRVLRKLAQTYVRVHHPKVIAVAGSVGKTSSKLMLARILETQYKVSYMDDSYNSGIGLYLSVFQLKVPARSNIFSWAIVCLRACWRGLIMHPEFLVLEYGIDTPGEMDKMITFIQPDISLLTAVTPEHMEFLKTIDTVGFEETKIISAAKEYAVVSTVDVARKYYESFDTVVLPYGAPGDSASYTISELSASGASVEFLIDGQKYSHQVLRLISEPTIRQLSGAMLLAHELGVTRESIEKALPRIRAAASRMSLLEGVHDSTIIDDTANFSPAAGVIALQTLKQMPAKRRIAVLGNMHELGDFADEGYDDVAREFSGIDMLVFVGDHASVRFTKLASQHGFVDGKTMFVKADALEVGDWLRDDILAEGDMVLVKGPFGGWYLEEAVKRIVKHSRDTRRVTRQSAFWDHKKRAHFGSRYDD